MKHLCPDCHKVLHEGMHTFADGKYHVAYCKGCGYRDERAL